MKSLNKEIKFDGSKFWLKDEVVGEIEDQFKFQDSYDKDFLDNQKHLCLGKIIQGEI